jgi:hypothetical protein
LKNRSFSDSPPGTESALWVGFGGGFGVKVCGSMAGESGLPGTFDDRKRFK